MLWERDELGKLSKEIVSFVVMALHTHALTDCTI